MNVDTPPEHSCGISCGWSSRLAREKADDTPATARGELGLISMVNGALKEQHLRDLADKAAEDWLAAIEPGSQTIELASPSAQCTELRGPRSKTGGGCREDVILA